MANGLVKEELTARPNTVAEDLRVTSSALRWRLVARRKAQAGDRAIVAGPMAALFSGPFVNVLGLAVERGNISMRRAADLLNLAVDDRDELLATHGIESSVEP